MNLILIVFLNIIGFFLLYEWIRMKISDYRSESDKRKFFTYQRHKYMVTIGAIILIPCLLIQFTMPDLPRSLEPVERTIFSEAIIVGVSFLISLFWVVYIRMLDIFRPEKWHHIILVFVLGAISMQGVKPIATFINEIFNLKLNNEPLNDFIYCVVSIGMVEEILKLIPLILILNFTKIVDEPYDYILYGSISALGFAFLENILYIRQSELYAINARALMSSVAHMTFTSAIAYSVMLVHYNFKRKRIFYYISGFLIAAFMHGFYDFWLTNPVAKNFSFLTTLFFLGAIHVWFTMKNNSLNVSSNFNEKLLLENDRLKYFLVVSMVGLLMISALLISFYNGRDSGFNFLSQQVISYGYFVFYLSFSFSRFELVEGYMAPLHIPFNFFMPRSVHRHPPLKQDDEPPPPPEHPSIH